MTSIILTIEQECCATLDNFSKLLIVSQFGTLLNYAVCFYHRQFLTREKVNCEVLAWLETRLLAYLNGPELADRAIRGILPAPATQVS